MRPTQRIPNRWLSLTIAAALLAASAAFGIAQADPATRVANAIWAHDELYDTVATVTSFKSPPPGTTDVIFAFDDSVVKGQRSVAESAPGDRDYNGGRWNVMVVVFTDQGLAIHDADQDGSVDFELTNAEMVLHHASLGHLIIMPAGVYFECPMLPRRNR